MHDKNETRNERLPIPPEIGHYGAEPTLFDHVLLERPMTITAKRKELLPDLTFSRGFAITPFHSNSWDGKPIGYLTYDGKKAVGKAVWRLAQWGCTHDIATQALLKRENHVLTYTDGGKTLCVDTDKPGAITLGIQGSTEYPLDENGVIRDRLTPVENWPHILLEQILDTAISSDAQHLMMDIEYEVTKCESLVDREKYPLNPDMHAAQFQWFLLLKNTDEKTPSFGAKMWFGFSMFDTRSLDATPNGFHAYDGGKEDSTGLFIYMPSLADMSQNPAHFVNEAPTSVLNKKIQIKIDVLTELKKAFEIAQTHGAMQGADPKKLKIVSTNVGWELPGNYDVSVRISRLNLYEEY